jgi:hypothetical protein
MINEPSNLPRSSFPFFTDAILAIAIPVAGYYVAYRYEQGYLTYFGVPTSLVEVGLSEVLGVLGQLISVFLLILGYLDIRATLSKDKNPVARAIGRVLFPILIMLLIIYAASLKGATLYFLLALLALVIFTEFIFPIFSQRKVKGFKEKLAQQELRDGMQQSLMSNIMASYKRGNYALKSAINFTVLFALFYIFFLGSFTAKRSTSFMVLKTCPEMIAIKKYSNRLICVEFDRANKTIKREFKVLNMDEIAEAKTTIVQENIGPLKPVKATIKESETAKDLLPEATKDTSSEIKKTP